MIMYLIYWNTFCQFGLYLLQVYWLKIIFVGFYRTVFGSTGIQWLVKEEKAVQAGMKAEADAKSAAKAGGKSVPDTSEVTQESKEEVAPKTRPDTPYPFVVNRGLKRTGTPISPPDSPKPADGEKPAQDKKND